MFQTISQFLSAPFGEREIKSNEMERKYQELLRNKKINIFGYCQIDDNFLIHVKVGSDTNAKEYYDVVLLFFTDNEEIKRKITIKDYYVKFFSNSPSFIYQYSALYKQNGYLIDELFDKVDQDYIDKIPDRINKMSYDKSIYSACRYIDSNNHYGKFLQSIRKTPPDKFFRNIRDFQDIKMTSEIKSLDRKINAELKKNKNGEDKKSSNTRSKSNTNNTVKVIKPKTRTTGSVKNTAIKKAGGKSPKKKSTRN